MTVICVCLFIGAMGKCAVSAARLAAGFDGRPDADLGADPRGDDGDRGHLHGARMSPLFELSVPALSFVIVIGAITAFFMGILGIVQNDIKRVVAYSTLSQLGYMTVALGVSAYSVGIFHLMTHAFFKALLFLGRGLGDHRHASRPGYSQHGRLVEEDACHMDHGTDRIAGADWGSVLLGLLLEGLDHHCCARSARCGSVERVGCLLGTDHRRVHHGVLFVSDVLPRLSRQAALARKPHAVAHDEHHADEDHGEPHESANVVTVPLVLLAIPSVVIGFVTAEWMLGGDFFGDSIFVDSGTASGDDPRVAEEAHRAAAMGLHGLVSLPTYLGSRLAYCSPGTCIRSAPT